MTASNKNILLAVIDVWAILALVSIFIYSATGWFWWADTLIGYIGSFPVYDNARAIALTVLHLLPILIAGFRRIP